jgi:hypothetical protein
MALSVTSTKANSKSLQESAKLRTAMVTIPGEASGTATSRNVRNRLAPETHADSSYDRGTVWKNCHMSQRPNGSTSTLWAMINPA